jgi:hypothetical protein
MTSILKVDSIQNAAGTAAMTIDSSGTVTTKAKESFVLLGYELSSAAYSSPSSGDKFPFNQVAQSKGTGASDWNNTTKEYTAPCNGIYSWHIASITNATTNTVDWRLHIDGLFYHVASWQNGGRGYNGSGQVYLNQGQTLSWVANNATTKLYGNVGGVGSAGSYTSGSVALIREIV